MGYGMVCLFHGECRIDVGGKEIMNLKELKKQASLDQKLLIEKVENLVRSEYDRDDMLAEIRREYVSRVGKRIIDIMPDYKPYISPRDGSLFKEFCHKVGDFLREELEYDQEV